MAFYPGLNPENFRRLTIRELNALVKYHNASMEQARGR